MIEHIEAIYEHGVFRPLTALPLADKERVHLMVKSGKQDWLDADAHRIAEREPDPDLSLEEIRAELAQTPGSWGNDVIAERGEY